MHRGAVRVARYARFAFYTHTWITILLIYAEDRRSIEIPLARGEKSSTRLWQGSCCIGYIMNAQLKIVGYVASRRCANWFCARESLYLREYKSLPRVASGCIMIAMSLPLCSLISDRVPRCVLRFPFPPFSHCLTIRRKFRSPMLIV